MNAPVLLAQAASSRSDFDLQRTVIRADVHSAVADSSEEDVNDNCGVVVLTNEDISDPELADQVYCLQLIFISFGIVIIFVVYIIFEVNVIGRMAIGFSCIRTVLWL